MQKPKKQDLFIPGLICFLIAFSFGTIGWIADGAGITDGPYKALQSFVLGDTYNNISDKPIWVRIFLEIARFFGVLTAFFAVIILLWNNLRIGFTWFCSRFHRKNHIVVVGDSPLAHNLAMMGFKRRGDQDALTRIVHLTASVEKPGMHEQLIRLPFSDFDKNGFDEAAADRACKLIIATPDAVHNINLALAAQKHHGNLPIVTLLNNIWLDRSIHQLPGAKLLRFFSECGSAAREIVRRHPPFLLAQDRQQSRMNFVLIGEGDWVEAIMAEIILSACTLTYGKPAFRIVVPSVKSFEDGLSHRYPELSEAADVSTFEFGPNDQYNLEHILKGFGAVTAVYCAFSDDARSLTAALSTNEQRGRISGFTAPIFVRVQGQAGLERPIAGAELINCEIVAFGSMADIAAASGILSTEADKAEKQWHAAYLATGAKGPAAVPWEELSEAFRISNRRAVAHTYAKLFEAGFDLRPWLATAQPWDELPALGIGEKLYRDDSERERLAILEHERWNNDRRMLGWRYGTPKDNSRKIHDCLTTYEKLPLDIRQYDIDLIKHLDATLPRNKGGIRR